MSCRDVRLADVSSSVYMCTRCARNWKDDEVRRECEEELAGATDPFLTIPVTSRSTNVTYKNVRCAVCNRDFNVKMWTAFLRSLTDKAMQACPHFGHPSQCPVFLGCPDFMHGKRPQQYFRVCRSDLVSDCPADFHDRNSRLRDGCHAYFAPVQDLLTGVNYKNFYCALCYGVSMTDIACVEEGRMVEYPWIEEDQSEEVAHKDVLPSYSLLIDVDFSRGGAKVGLQDRCAPNQAYDPWKQTCRNLVCGKLFEFRDGLCVASALRAAYGSSAAPHALLASNCSKVALDADEFTLWENHTATLRADAGTGELLVPGEYELRADGSILVCAESGLLPARRMAVYKFRDTDGYITLAGSIVSLACLLVKMALQMRAPGPWKLPDLLISMLSLSIFAAQLLFLFVMVAARQRALCTLIGMLVHYFFLASFFWTNALALDLYWSVASIADPTKRRGVHTFCLFSAYCWSLPCLVVLLSAAMDLWILPASHPLSPGYGRGVCWISNRLALLAFFAAPIAAIVAVNMAVFALCVVRISGTLTHADKLRRGAHTRWRLMVYVKLALVMGATWTLGFVAPFARAQALWHAFVILNSLQGAFVFFAFTRLALRHRLASWLQAGRSKESSRRAIVSAATTVTVHSL
uniref:Putative class b secretin-like g-protein coupled receptor gprmth5 n=1 Tax=Amblyomma aureolatum TaxID=187763 RepID=A0A1E1XEH3_9ACAR